MGGRGTHTRYASGIVLYFIAISCYAVSTCTQIVKEGKEKGRGREEEDAHIP